jgi:hypothetical protein
MGHMSDTISPALLCASMITSLYGNAPMELLPPRSVVVA